MLKFIPLLCLSLPVAAAFSGAGVLPLRLSSLNAASPQTIACGVHMGSPVNGVLGRRAAFNEVIQLCCVIEGR